MVPLLELAPDADAARACGVVGDAVPSDIGQRDMVCWG